MNLHRIVFCLVVALSPVQSLAATDAPAPAPAPYDPTRPAESAGTPRAELPKELSTTGPATPAVVPDIQLPAASAPALKRGALSNVPSFLWEVKSPSNRIWLFGTMHVGKRAFYPLPDAVESAFDSAAKLVVEADVSNPATGDLNALISYFPPDALDKNLPKALQERLRAQLARLQIPQAAVMTMKPFVVGGFLAVMEFSRLGYDMTLGVDSYLLGRAKEAGKPVEELESVRSQLEMLAAMPAPLQEAFLDNAISTLELGRSADQVIGMVNAWQTGDPKLMAEVVDNVNRGMKLVPQLDAVLLHGRHDSMLAKIDGYLAERQPYFVAVGSLHLVGPRGLIEALKAKGYEVKQK